MAAGVQQPWARLWEACGIEPELGSSRPRAGFPAAWGDELGSGSNRRSIWAIAAAAPFFSFVKKKNEDSLGLSSSLGRDKAKKLGLSVFQKNQFFEILVFF